MIMLDIYEYDHAFLVGKVVDKIDVIKDGKLNNDTPSQERDRITIYTKCGHEVSFLHNQQCCEQVWIDDIMPDIQILVGCEILKCEKNTVETGNKYTDFETQTATFYKIASISGWVDIVWRGESNGYYSEGVDVEIFAPENTVIQN
jgi:hypothetical protein